MKTPAGIKWMLSIIGLALLALFAHHRWNAHHIIRLDHNPSGACDTEGPMAVNTKTGALFGCAAVNGWHPTEAK